MMRMKTVVLCIALLAVGINGAASDSERVVAQAGTRLLLSCPGRSSVGDPLLVSWRCRDCRSGQVEVTLAEYGRDRAVTIAEDLDRVSLDRRSFQLSIDPLRVSDSGNYVCLINNAPNPQSILVVAQDVPGAPGRPLVIGFSSNSANISWAPSTNSRTTPVQHYMVQIKEGETGAWGLLGAVETPDNRTAFTVTGLRPYTVYSFRVLGVNELGQGAPSSPSYFMVTHRELPAARPVIVSARNISSEKIEVAWNPAPMEQMNGEFLGYQLTFQSLTLDSDADQWTAADLPEINATKFVIDSLQPYTPYRIRLQYLNMLGLGPPTDIDVLTDEGEPASPESLSVLISGDTWAKLRWRAPRNPGAHIVGYYVYFETDKEGELITDVRIVDRVGDSMTFNLTRLDAFTEYKVWTCAKSGRSEGRRSDPVNLRTDVTGPGSPLINNITCRDGNSIYVHWHRPMQVYGALDFYLVEFRSEEDHQFEELVIPSASGRDEEAMFLPNLTSGTMYEVRVAAGANSVYDPARTYLGRRSEPRKLLVQNNCEALQRQQRLMTGPWNFTPGVAAGLACALAAVLLASLAYVMWKKYFQEAYNHLEEQNKTPSVLSTDWENDSPEGQAGPVPVHMFPKHVAHLHADGDVGYSKEFEAIQTQTMMDAYTSNFSQEPENKSKNRYLNIIAYDHTRVPLSALPGQKRCDYVNANYIDGYQRSRAYIGTQGPLPDTYDTFWRMIWEQDVRIIVMITNLIERGRKKCDLYWPQEGSETYGLVKVTAAGEDVMATYTIRKFKIQCAKTKKSRRISQKIVYQYHYTHWPDHGIPENPLPLLGFIRKSAAANRESSAPIVVHCSAGVGRTGTYIVLDVMLQMIRARGELNIFGFLKYIRSQRNFLVQTEDQYVFIHDALQEAIESGETDIHCSFLSRYLHNLQTTDQDIYPWYNLERQFKLITYDQAADYVMTSARHPVNYHKNRSMELLPPEAHRVCLTPRPGIDGSDYINASWMMGFHRLQEFIITQHPLDCTVRSFWQMVWDHNTQTIVLLSPVDDQEFCIFWPLEHQDIQMDQFSVRFTGETLQGSYMIREFTVNSATDDYEMPVRIIQSSGWPLGSSPLGGVFELVRAVQQWQVGYQQGPCVVVDRLGGTEAATFCCLTSLLRQMEYEAHVDVYMYARMCHTQRPGVWRSQDDYLFLYRAVESLVSGSVAAPPAPPDVTNVTSSSSGSGYLQQPSPTQMSTASSLVTTPSYQYHQQPPALKPILKNGSAHAQYHVQHHQQHQHHHHQSPSRTIQLSNGHIYRIPPDGMETTVLNMGDYVNA